MARVFAVVLLFLSVPVFAEEPKEIWEKLGKLEGEERQKLLLSKARDEGEVVWYTTTSFDVLVQVKSDFENRYPGVALKIWKGSGGEIANRVLTEAASGKFYADVLTGGNEFLPTLRKSKLVGRYDSAEREFYSDTHKGRDWTSFAIIHAVIAYNSQLVRQSEIPQGYEDFLDSRWKGSFAIDTDPDRALMGWFKIWGEERTERFLKDLMGNEPNVRRGHTLITQLLCAGEFKAALELYTYRLAEMQDKGCPLEMVFPDPTPGAPSLVFVAKNSPHPYGAALLVDYLLSDFGQGVIVNKGWYSARRGVKLKYPEMDIKGKKVRELILSPEDTEQWGEKYLKLRAQYLLVR